MGKSQLHFRHLGACKQHIQHRNLWLAVLGGQPQLPVARRNGGAVAPKVVGGQPIVLPQDHGKHIVDHMAGAEEKHIVFPVVL